MNLLPCPFCGTAPISEPVDSSWVVGCTNENCHASPVVVAGRTEEIAKTRWNGRAPGLPLEVVLSEENDRLITAIKPFAEVARHDIGEDEADSDLYRPMTNHNKAPHLTVGDFRRALDAIAKAETK